MRLLPRYTRSAVLTYHRMLRFYIYRKPCKITPKSNFFSASPAVGSTVRLLPRYTRSAVLTYRGMLRSSTIASLAKSLLKAIF